MECNCNNNNNRAVIPWVRGNRLPLVICVYEDVVTQEGEGSLVHNKMERVPYEIQAADTVTVVMKSGFRQVEMPFTTEGNKVLVTDNGELAAGTYTVEVTIVRGDGARGRWQETRQVRVYENTSDAQLGEMYAIEADLFFYAKGDTGNGIADITSNPDDTLTITMTDGTTYTTQAMKGDKGDKGDQGEKGTSIVSFDVTGQTDTSVIYTVTFSDDTTEEVAVPKGPQGDTGLTGNGIASATLNSDYTLTIAYTDGTTYTTPSIRGAQGVQGVSIIAFTQTGETATNTLYNVVFSDGRTQSVAIPKGVKGDKGDTGNPGSQGAQGPKGDTVTATDYTLYNVQGGSSEGAMSQDATTKAISAQTGYYTCGTAAGTPEKVVTVESGNLYKRTLGGHFKVKMTNTNTAASGATLKIGSETSAALWYNGAAVSAQNTWDANEIISVFFDGTNYQASNAQGGGGKAEKISYNNSQSGLAADNVQGALDEMDDELTELAGKTRKLDGLTEEIPVSYTEGFYINDRGNLSGNASWMASDFLDISAVAAGDTFVWSGISKGAGSCIAFYDEDGTFMQAFSATGASRTIKIASDAAAIGATKVRASFLINGTPSLSKNGVDVIASNTKTQIIGMEELSNSVNQLNKEVPELMDFMQSADGIVLNHKDYSSWDKSNTSGKRVRFIYTEIAGAKVKVSANSGYSLGIAVYSATTPTGTAVYDSGWKIGTFEYTVPSSIGCMTINTAKGSDRSERITFEESEQNVSKIVRLGNRSVTNDAEKDNTNLITSGAVYDAVYGNGNLAYYGNRVILAPYFFRGAEYMAVSQPSGVGQGAAVYGNYFIQGGTGGKVRVYDLLTKSVVADSVSLTDTASTNHVNNICFSNIFPNGNDTFPYMYVSECFGQRRCYVENFTLSGSILVQTISYNGNDVFDRNWVIDTENGFIYLIGNTKQAYNVQGNMVRVKKFTLPLPTAGDVVFTADDVLDTFDMDGSTGKACVFQGNTIFNRKLYSCFGGSATTHRIWVNNLETHILETVIELDQMYRGECESINIWEGTLLIGYPNQGKLYQLKF